MFYNKIISSNNKPKLCLTQFFCRDVLIVLVVHIGLPTSCHIENQLKANCLYCVHRLNSLFNSFI